VAFVILDNYQGSSFYSDIISLPLHSGVQIAKKAKQNHRIETNTNFVAKSKHESGWKLRGAYEVVGGGRP
jgi:hypothetical protein